MSNPHSRAEATVRHHRAEPSFSAYNRLVALAFVGDAAIVWLALLAAWWLRFQTGLAAYGVQGPAGLTLPDYFGHFLVGLGLMMAVLANFRLYDRRNFLSLRSTVWILVKTAFVWIGVYLGLSLILKFNPPISRVYGVTALAVILVVMPLWRWTLWKLTRREEIASRLRQRALVVGWNEEFQRTFDLLGNVPHRHFEICGVVKPSRAPFDNDLPKGVRFIGRYEDLHTLLRMGLCDVVLVADQHHQNGEMMELAAICEKEMIEFKMVPTCFRVLLSGLHLETVGDLPVLGISKLPLHSAVNQYLKRVVDIVGSIAGLILSAPVIAVFGYLIRRESPGPIFYRQRRLGQSGELFDMFKLRSMRLDAEEDNTPGWTVKDDPRCLKIGRFMRRWNIDELPQFWNVLKGEMSLVGPRPERPELIDEFKEVIPHYNARHHIKPGITGWAQVSGLRGDTDLEERIRMDLHYIENWNFIFDFQIMLMTFFRRENAC